MTKISTRKTKLTFETSATYRGLPIIFEPGTHETAIRLKGRRFRYSVPYIAIFELGAKILANEKRRAREEARKKGRTTK